MAAVNLPYKLQVFLPDDLRKRVKDLAHARDLSIQDLVVNVLTAAVSQYDDDQAREALARARPHQAATPAGGA